MIEVKNIHKSFKNVEVLKGVDLVVEDGQTVALIGSSGRLELALVGDNAAQHLGVGVGSPVTLAWER